MSAALIRPFRDGEALEVAAWAYEPPCDVYDGDSRTGSCTCGSKPMVMATTPLSIRRNEDLAGFCCFGQEARVDGQEESERVIDIGGGVRPDLLSEGVATRLLPLIMDFVRERFAPEQFRTAVASFNERSTSLCVSSGFTVVRRFDGPDRKFLELLRPA